MANVISTTVFLTLLCVCFAALLVPAEELRVDAEQEGFETLATATNSTDPTSTLFGSCLAATRQVEAKIHSIKLDGTTTEWVRNVPDNATLQETITWTDASSPPAITSIADCVAAANAGGKKMFKYGPGTACKLSAVAYTFAATQACEDRKTDAVFVIAM